MLGRFHYRSDERLNASSIKLFVLSPDSGSRERGARLITPYYHTHDAQRGCLLIDYRAGGNGFLLLRFTQQDRKDTELFTERLAADQWRQAKLDLDLTRGDPRFFITGETVPNKGATVALSRILLVYKPCNLA